MTPRKRHPDGYREPRADDAELVLRAVGDDLANEFGLERLMDMLRAAPEERLSR